jgi:hypothetical protein
VQVAGQARLRAQVRLPLLQALPAQQLRRVPHTLPSLFSLVFPPLISFFLSLCRPGQADQRRPGPQADLPQPHLRRPRTRLTFQ